jgi:hypothetical protein
LHLTTILLCLTFVAILSDNSSIPSNNNSVPFDVNHHSVQRLSPFCPTFIAVLFDVCCHSVRHLSSFVYLILSIHRHPFIIHPRQRTVFFKLYVVLELCSWCSVLLQNFEAWDNTMSLNDESTTTQPQPKYQLRKNTQSLKSISLSSQFS